MLEVSKIVKIEKIKVRVTNLAIKIFPFKLCKIFMSPQCFHIVFLQHCYLVYTHLHNKYDIYLFSNVSVMTFA